LQRAAGAAALDAAKDAVAAKEAAQFTKKAATSLLEETQKILDAMDKVVRATAELETAQGESEEGVVSSEETTRLGSSETETDSKLENTAKTAVKAQMAVYELKILEEMVDCAVRRAEEMSANAKAARMLAEAYLKMVEATEGLDAEVYKGAARINTPRN
jgi:hypothetical protein